MHSITLRMDRVFDVQLDCFSGNLRRTLFSFESGGKRYFSILVDGEPKLQSGQTITAVLKRPDDWQTFLAMRVHETGEVFAPSIAISVWWLLIVVFLAGIAFMELRFSDPAVLMPVLVAHLLVALAFAYKAVISAKIHRALRF